MAQGSERWVVKSIEDPLWVCAAWFSAGMDRGDFYEILFHVVKG